MLVECFEQIELRVLLDLDADVVELPDGSITCEEVLGPRSETDDLQVTDGTDCFRDGMEIGDHVCTVVSVSDRILGDVRLEVAQLQVVARIEHSAICVAPVVEELVACLLSRCDDHRRSVEILDEQRLGCLGTEVAEIYDERIASCRVDILERLLHVDLILDRDLALIDVSVLLLVFSDQRRPPALGQAHGETVSADRHDTDLYLRHILRKNLCQSCHALFLLAFIM